MLVLTRKPGEAIVIGDGIRVTVVSVGPGRVKIGIEAPPTVQVDRQEVYEKRQAERAAAARPEAAAPEPAAPLHNRIADKLPPEPPAPPVASPVAPPVAVTPPALANRLKGLDRRYPPRKPR